MSKNIVDLREFVQRRIEQNSDRRSTRGAHTHNQHTIRTAFAAYLIAASIAASAVTATAIGLTYDKRIALLELSNEHKRAEIQALRAEQIARTPRVYGTQSK